MEGTQHQSTNAPVVHRGCGCPHGSKNRLSTTQVPTQEGGRRGEFHSDAALTQPVQGEQDARVRSINPQVPKLTQKPTKVTTTNMVRNKEVELTLYVFDAVYRQELVLSVMLEKVKPVLDTSYEPYISNGNQEDNKETEFFQTDEGQLVVRDSFPAYLNLIHTHDNNKFTNQHQNTYSKDLNLQTSLDTLHNDRVGLRSFGNQI
ncbi:hypothetical protein DSO57_1035135 [Entomophthora muscae]|uniref:Uncharacterized protein n=1 Tax=Entomophthora muscae TaxID=34485 RepID=A0ACC2REF2_9FUNG|nr:hypothetical protein DSO57_1035135 [Entomophthora muscae]